MNDKQSRLGKGPAIDFQIRNRKGQIVESLTVPEEQVNRFFSAASSASRGRQWTIDPYGDSMFSCQQCKSLREDSVSVLDQVSGPEGRECFATIADAISRVADDPSLNFFVVGN